MGGILVDENPYSAPATNQERCVSHKAAPDSWRWWAFLFGSFLFPYCVISVLRAANLTPISVLGAFFIAFFVSLAGVNWSLIVSRKPLLLRIVLLIVILGSYFVVYVGLALLQEFLDGQFGET